MMETSNPDGHLAAEGGPLTDCRGGQQSGPVSPAQQSRPAANADVKEALFSLPADSLDVGDLSAGFTYGKPVTLSPNQFSKRATGPDRHQELPRPPRWNGELELPSILPGNGPGPGRRPQILLDRSSPPLHVNRVSAGSNGQDAKQESTVPCASHHSTHRVDKATSGSDHRSTNPREDPSFHSPAYTSTTPQRNETEASRQGVEPGAGDVALSATIAPKVKRIIHDQSPPSNVAGSDQHRSRHEKHRTTAANRMRTNRPLLHAPPDASIRILSKRSGSRGSNISKKRAVRLQTSRRTGSICSDHSQGTTATRSSVSNSEVIAGMTNSAVTFLNPMMDTVRNQLLRKDATIGDLKYRNAKKSEHISSLEAAVLGLEKKLQAVGDEKDRLDEERSKAVRERDQLLSREESSRAKLQRYKDHINSALEEQQELYKDCQASYQRTLDELKATESRRKSIDGQARQQLESITQRLEYCRNELQELQKDRADSHDKIQELRQQVSAKDHELSRLRESAHVLAKGHAVEAAIQGNLQGLLARTDEILKKASSFESKTVTIDKNIAEMQHSQLREILERLDTLETQTRLGAGNVKALTTSGLQLIKSITEKPEAAAAGQHTMWSDTLSHLEAKIEAQLGALKEDLKSREDALIQEISEKRSENAFLIQALERKDLECEDLSAREHELVEQARAQGLKINKLEARLEQVLSETPSPAIDGLVELERYAATRDAEIANLREELAEKDQALVEEVSRHRDESSKLSRALQDLKEATISARQQVAETVHEEVASSSDVTNQVLLEDLSQAELDRSGLRKALEAAQQELSQANERGTSITKSLESQLTTMKSRHSVEMRSLRAKLSRTEKKVAELETDREAITDETRMMLDRLHQWARDSCIDIIGTESKSPHGTESFDTLPPSFPLKELARFLTTVSQHYHVLLEQLGGLAVAPSGPGTTGPLLMTPPDTLALERRVSLRSPADDLLEPSPPSIVDERKRRREAVLPKSIMKRAARSMPQAQEQESSREYTIEMTTLPGLTSFGRGRYNRPVAGSLSSSLAKQEDYEPACDENDGIAEQGDLGGESSSQHHQVVDNTPARKPRKRPRPAADAATSLKKQLRSTDHDSAALTEAEGTPKTHSPPKGEDVSTHIEKERHTHRGKDVSAEAAGTGEGSEPQRSSLSTYPHGPVPGAGSAMADEQESRESQDQLLPTGLTKRTRMHHI